MNWQLLLYTIAPSIESYQQTFNWRQSSHLQGLCERMSKVNFNVWTLISLENTFGIAHFYHKAGTFEKMDSNNFFNLE